MRPKDSHMAQIKALGQFYQDQVSKSWWRQIEILMVGGS